MEPAFKELTSTFNKAWVDEWTRDADKATRKRGKYLDIYDVNVQPGKP